MTTTMNRPNVQIPPQKLPQIATQFAFERIERAKTKGDDDALLTCMIVALRKIARGDSPEAKEGDVDFAQALLYQYGPHPKKLLRVAAVEKLVEHLGSGGNGGGGNWQTGYGTQGQERRSFSDDPFSGRT